MYLNIKLDEKEQKNFEVAKEHSGLKSNTEFLRAIIRKYILKVHGSFPEKGKNHKMYVVEDLLDLDELLDNSEPSYRRGFVQGFCFCQEIPKLQWNKVEDILHDWRHKESQTSMMPPDLYVRERLNGAKK